MIRGGLGFPVSNAVLNSMVKDYSFSSPGGSSGIYYAGGFYEAAAADTTLTQVFLVQTYGTTNVAYAAHAFIVAGGAGTVDTGQVGLKVTGTRIQDDGTRTTSYAYVLTEDITTLSLNDYLEAPKYIGQMTFELYVVSGTPTAYSLDFNYGVCKYDDMGNNAFDITHLEVVGRCGGTDSGFNVGIMHHTDIGWTYHATAFVPGTGYLEDMNTDHNTEVNIANGEYFAWKRADLDKNIRGNESEGFIFKIETSANNAIESMNLHLTARF